MSALDALPWTHEHDGIETIRKMALSPCGVYRYGLSVQWDTSGDIALWLMLNPSTATHTQGDPTVNRCINRSYDWGFGGIVVANLFALRSTDPAALYNHGDPVGPENDRWIVDLARCSSRVVCGWGEHGKLNGRSTAVLALLKKIDVPIGYLRLNKSGEPAHPLYLPHALLFTPWRTKT